MERSRDSGMTHFALQAFAFAPNEKVSQGFVHVIGQLAMHADQFRKRSFRTKRSYREALALFLHGERNQEKIVKDSRRSLREAASILLSTIDCLRQRAASKSKWPPSSERLAKAFRGSAKSGTRALHGKDPAQFHEWRKRAKRLLYQLQLTQGDANKRMIWTINRVDQLQDQLGEYHDAVIVQGFLQRYPCEEISRQFMKHSVYLLEERKHCLKQKVRKLARHLQKK